VQELVACDSEVQEALADTLEAVQKIGSRTCWLRINTTGSPDRFSKG
jgi:hypothetical protein